MVSLLHLNPKLMTHHLSLSGTEDPLFLPTLVSTTMTLLTLSLTQTTTDLPSETMATVKLLTAPRTSKSVLKMHKDSVNSRPVQKRSVILEQATVLSTLLLPHPSAC